MLSSRIVAITKSSRCVRAASTLSSSVIVNTKSAPSLSPSLYYAGNLLSGYSDAATATYGNYTSLHHLPTLQHRWYSATSSTLSSSVTGKKSFASTTAFAATDDDHNHPAGHQDALNPMPDFDDAMSAYESKSKGELVRAALSFTLCQMPFLVNHAETLLKLSRKILRDTVTDFALKQTLYGHFCAGEDELKIIPKIKELEQNGIGSILDFAAEDEEEAAGSGSHESMTEIISSSGENSSDEQALPIVRVYDYESEAKCDKHVETFKKCIRDVSTLQKDGYAAVKVTALGNPKLLERMSRAIVEVQNLFAKFDQDGDGLISRKEFERGFEIFFRDDATKLKEMMEQASPDGTTDIDYITWSMLLQPKDIPDITFGCREIGPLAMATPTEEEIGLLENTKARLHALGEEAAKQGTRLLIDAEHFRYQPAIDSLCLDVQRTYNATDVTDFPIIYNTYQCYLKDSLDRLKTDVERSERFGYHFGTKLVRGAYMEGERKLAEEFGYPSPIHDTIEDTHKSYDGAVEYLLRHSKQSGGDKKLELMLATHNQQSVENAIRVMNELGIDRTDSIVSFAQLYGMKDNLTFNLGKNKYRAYKYVPYGEVKMVVPYLIRRANENSSVAGSASIELKLVLKELSRRLKGGGRKTVAAA